MPILLPTDELSEGMRLYEPIITAGRVMLQADKALTPTDIDSLRRRYPKLLVRVVDPWLDGRIEFEDDTDERTRAAEVQKTVSGCLSNVHDRFTRRATLASADIGALQTTVRDLSEYLKRDRASAALVARCTDPETYLGAHGGNVFYLSMLLATAALDYVLKERQRQTAARDLRYDVASDLVPLGLAAMLLDVGMVPIERVLRPGHVLTAEESDALRGHPEAGAAALPPDQFALVRTVVRTHHENLAGTGYPRQLAGEKLHVFTRIVRIADAYDAATSEVAYGEARAPVRVLWELSGPLRDCYDSELLRAFLKLMQPFPIGARIKLQDGRQGVVVKYNRGAPFEPFVVPTFDAAGEHLLPEELAAPQPLGSTPALRGASFEGAELGFLYRPAPQLVVPARGQFRTAFDAAYP